jgi:bacterioferritin (cytochrome b1)
MQGDPDVINALQDVYKFERTLEEQAHLTEHLYESRKWTAISKWFDCIETKLHERCLHFVINRINDLGGSVLPGYSFEPQVFPVEQLDMALDSMASRLGELRSLYIGVCNAASTADDYVTEKLAWKHQEKIEGWLLKFQGRLAKLRLLGLNAFLQELMTK